MKVVDSPKQRIVTADEEFAARLWGRSFFKAHTPPASRKMISKSTKAVKIPGNGKNNLVFQGFRGRDEKSRIDQSELDELPVINKKFQSILPQTRRPRNVFEITFGNFPDGADSI